MACVLLLFTSTILCLCFSSVSTLDQCNSKVISNGGDIILPVILQLHEPENNQCGRISLTEFQVAVAVHWLMDKYLNGNTTDTQFIPGVKFGYRIHDDCGLPSLATKRTLDILPDIISNDLRYCGDITSANKVIAGVFGTTVSETSVTVAKLVEKARIPLIGFSATLPELRDTSLYPNSIPTVPPDTEQVKAIFELVKILEWTFMGVIYSDDSYGHHGYNALKEMATDANICVRLDKMIPRDVLSSDDIFSQVIYSLGKILVEADNRKFGIIYFGQPGPAAILLRNIYQGVIGSQGFEGITWIMSEAVGDSPEVKEAVKGVNIDIYFLTPPQRTFSAFETTFLDVLTTAITDSSNDKFKPYTAEYLKDMYNCDTKAACSLSRLQLKSKFVQHEYLQSVIDAVYLEAIVMKALHSKYCGNVNGLCQSLITRINDEGLIQEYKDRTLRFNTIASSFLPPSVDIQRNLTVSSAGTVTVFGDPLYKLSVLLRDKMNEVGVYTASGLNFKKTDLITIFQRNTKDLGTSQCGKTCSSCMINPKLPYAFIKGDLYILGLFSIHSQGDGYNCGEWRSTTSSPSALLSFMNSIERYANRSGIKLGGIAVDDCYNPLHANDVLTNIFTGEYQIQDPDTGEVIHQSRIVGVVGASSSGVTIVSSLQTNNLKLPLISYAASSPDLDNRHSYPYFLRTVPSDTMQANVMVTVLRRLGITYVGVIYIDSNYGWNGAMQFKKIAEPFKICVHEPFAVPVINTDEDIRNIINTINKYYIKVIIFFGIDTLAIRFVKVLNLQGQTDLTFIASETWGTNNEIIQSSIGISASAAMGSLSLVVGSKNRLDDSFDDYVRRVVSNPDFTQNPWLQRFIMDKFLCNYPGSFEVPYSTRCPEKFDYNILAGLADDQRVVHTSYAVRAMANALIQATVALCKSKLEDSCIKSLQDNIDTVVGIIKDVELTDAKSKTFRVFDDNMNGAIGFDIYNIQRRDTGGFHYVQIGSYNEANGLALNGDKLEFYDELGNPTKQITADCASISGCKVCANKLNSSTQSPTDGPSSAATVIIEKDEACLDLTPAVVVLAIFCVLLLAVVCFFGFMMYRTFQHGTSQSAHTLSTENHSILDRMVLRRRHWEFISVHLISLEKIRKKEIYGIGVDHYDVANAPSLPENTPKEKVFSKPHLRIIGRTSTDPSISFNPNANGTLQQRRNTTSSVGVRPWNQSSNSSFGSAQFRDVMKPNQTDGINYDIAKNVSDSSTDSVFRRPSTNDMILQRPMHTVPECSPPIQCSSEDYVDPAPNSYIAVLNDSPVIESPNKPNDAYLDMKSKARKPPILQKPQLPDRKQSPTSHSEIALDIERNPPKSTIERPLWAHVNLDEIPGSQEEYLNVSKPEQKHGIKNPAYLNEETDQGDGPGASNDSSECVSPIELKDDYMQPNDVWKTNVPGVNTTDI